MPPIRTHLSERFRWSSALPKALLLSATLLCGVLTFPAQAELRAGVAYTDVTPPVGTPSAGYGARAGAGMEGVHDPLLATALVIDNGEKQIALLGVDHLGYTSQMVDAVRALLRAEEATADVELYLGSSHTHAGGGAFLDVPVIGAALAGRYDQEIVDFYVEQAARAVIEAAGALQPAKVGIGYGKAEGLNNYRGAWPSGVGTQEDVALIKVTTADDEPLAALFNFAAHPTVLGANVMEFSADFVGFARDRVAELIGGDVQPVYFNGAQGDISPRAPSGDDQFERAESMGRRLGEVVKEIWDATEVSTELKIATLRQPYRILPEGTPGVMPVVAADQQSELNLIVFNDTEAFLTVPGEMSTIYDAEVKRFGGWIGYNQVSIFGLTNDAHGYIIHPEAWRHRTYESTVSFGGELYGHRVIGMLHAMLHELEPEGAHNEDRLQESTMLCELGELGGKE